METSKDIEPTGTLAVLPMRDAERIARDSERTELLVASVEEKARRYRGSLGEVLDELLVLARMLRSYASRHYTRVPWKSVALIAAALVYFLSPVDLIPDFLVGGFVDDIGLLYAVLRQVRSDVDAYKSWEKERAEAADTP
jgi:uncharacterized membrane protein YkvA (DUF1232 family)